MKLLYQLLEENYFKSIYLENVLNKNMLLIFIKLSQKYMSYAKFKDNNHIRY